MGLQEKFEQNWLGTIIVVAVIAAGTTWIVLDEVLVRPRDEEFARLQRRMEELETKQAQDWRPSRFLPAEPISQQAEHKDAPGLEREPPQNESAVRDTSAILEASESAPSPIHTQDLQSDEDAFQTDSYRLAVDSVSRRGATMDVVLLLDSKVDESFQFQLSNPHLIDDQGTPLNVDPASSGAFVKREVEISPRMAMRVNLSFCVLAKQTIGALFAGKRSFCANRLLGGSHFMLTADEILPKQGRKIILRLAESKNGK
jgi:hypothetical protein